MSLDAIEVFWITTLVMAISLTTAALLEARRDWHALRQFNGSARGVVARAAIRRETLRLCSQVALLVIAIPAVMSDRPTAVNPTTVALLLVPVFILLSTVSDRAMRDRLVHKLTEEIALERNASLVRMEARLNVRADERAGVVAAKADDLRDVADETASQVHDIHDATVPE